MHNEREFLIKRLEEEGFIKTREVMGAFREIDREMFTSGAMKERAYEDEPLPVGKGQTISAPSIVAMMLELLDLREGDKVFEIGAGSGYNAALMSRIVRRVVTVELEPSLARLARSNLRRAGVKNVAVREGDGSMGCPEEAPFDKAIVTCAVPGMPSEVVKQLREGGRIIAPVGAGRMQVLTLGIKGKGGLKKERYGGCVFVPLRKRPDGVN